ncbi:MAG: hypothetical protein AUI88_01060 [Gemmatimonadetes bacterium 13_1_40CM_3_70_8]|nr:MAG: hypothetical protein AUI88_01060 [Gemmatimonadetes bacterium 13_1_40CM_3_70_8]
MSVPIPHEDVEQSRREKGARIDALARIPRETLPQLLRAGNLLRALECDVLLRVDRGALLQLAQHALEFRKRIQPRVIGHRHEAGLGMVHTRGPQQGTHHEGPGRMARADLILEQPLHERRPQLGRHRSSGVLVDRPEGVYVTIRAAKAERLRLAPAAALERRESAAKARQVEHLHTDRRRPEVAIVRAEQDLMHPTGTVPRARRYGGGARGRPAR